MATKKKETKDGKKQEKVTAANAADESEPTLREFLMSQLFDQWQVTDAMIDVLLDSTMAVLKDKEIGGRTPQFSVASTLTLVSKAISLKYFPSDRKKDDIYLNAEDAEEPRAPGFDCHGKERVLNRPDLASKFASTLLEINDSVHGSPGLGRTRTGRSRGGRSSAMSGSRRSVNSRMSATRSFKGDVTVGGGNIAAPAAKKKMRRSDSEKKRIMEKKLRELY